MLIKLCMSDTVVSIRILEAKPLVTIKTKSQTALSSDLGWNNVVGFDVTANKAATGFVELTAKEPIIFAAQLRESKPWMDDLNLCQLPPCGGVGQACCDEDKCKSGLNCTGNKCAVPPPVVLPNPDLTSGKVTWTTTGEGSDGKDWNTQPVVDVYDKTGRHVAHIDCCSADRDGDKWEKPRSVTRDLQIVTAGVKQADLAHGRFTAHRIPIGNDDWKYTVTVELLFSNIVVSHSCSGKNSCDASW
jgi:hypothetical protein